MGAKVTKREVLTIEIKPVCKEINKTDCYYQNCEEYRQLSKARWTEKRKEIKLSPQVFRSFERILHENCQTWEQTPSVKTKSKNTEKFNSLGCTTSSEGNLHKAPSPRGDWLLISQN